MSCVECGAETAGTAQFCVRCGAPVAGQPSVITDAAAGAVSAAASGAAPVATVAAAMYGYARPEPYVPGRGGEVPARIRRVGRGYSWMAWGAVFGGWALYATGGYFGEIGSYPGWWLFAVIPLAVLAAVLFGLHIRLSLFLRRPSDASTATVAACGRGGHTLMLDAPCDGYPSGLRVRLAWWAPPELLSPGQRVTFYGRPGGAGRVLVSTSAQGGAFVGTGRRQPAPLSAGQALQDAPPQPDGQRARRRYLQWGPLGIAGAGFAAAAAATVIAAAPSLTGYMTVDQLRTGDCLTGSDMGLGTGNPWPYLVAAVPCSGPHLAEVFFAGNAWPKSLAAYPGDNAISDQGFERCTSAFSAYDGIESTASDISFDYVDPSGGDDWASGDRWLVCVAYQDHGRGPVMVDYSIKGSHR
jgi:hypothetical protein